MNRFSQVASNRWTRLVLVTLVLLSLQTTILNDLRPFGVMLPLTMLFAVAIGAVHGSESGALAGFVIGAMYDCVLATPLGLGALVVGAAGCAAGLLPHVVREPTWWSRALMIGLMTACGEMLFPIGAAIVGVNGWIHIRMLSVALVAAISGGLLAPLIVPLSRWTLREPVRA